MLKEEMSTEEQKIINMIEQACIDGGGSEWWAGLTAQEKHDAIMHIAKKLDKALEVK